MIMIIMIMMTIIQRRGLVPPLALLLRRLSFPLRDAVVPRAVPFAPCHR
jgi:hypothetical protein